jgi:hypothetical protein
VFDEMAMGKRHLDTQLEAIATDLDLDRDALVANARSLTEAGDQTAILGDRVRAGFIQQGVGDIRAALSIAMVVLAGWAAVPATGALLLGLWLRRSLAPRVPDRERSRRLDPRPSSDHGPAM